MRLSAPMFQLKRQAKARARTDNMPLHAALDAVAQAEGFSAWSHLASRASTQPTSGLASRFAPGEMILLAARPGHGKTLLALEILKDARRGTFFSLDLTKGEARARYLELGGQDSDPVRFDLSDGICADHIVRSMEGAAPGTLAVIDYLQLLDQRRAHPPLAQQVSALRAFARRSGVTVLCISQVDRRFEEAGRDLPGLDDVRLPNPLDLGLFDRTCFLHNGRMQLR